MSWFILTNQNFPADPSHYSPAPTPLPSCGGTQQICRIDAVDNGGEPLIDEALLRDMVTALNTGTENAKVKLQN